jgi:hypothetical protein
VGVTAARAATATRRGRRARTEGRPALVARAEALGLCVGWEGKVGGGYGQVFSCLASARHDQGCSLLRLMFTLQVGWHAIPHHRTSSASRTRRPARAAASASVFVAAAIGMRNGDCEPPLSFCLRPRTLRQRECERAASGRRRWRAVRGRGR